MKQVDCEVVLKHTEERRSRKRFPLDAELRFHVIRRGQGKLIKGTGQVVNISSRGLAFRTEARIDPGIRLGISMSWPALLEQKCLLRLALEGTVIRSEGSLVAVKIESHDFRTGGSMTGTARREIADLVRRMDPFPGVSTSDPAELHAI